jgi:hypothetical protein
VPRAIKSCRIRWNSEAVPASAASETRQLKWTKRCRLVQCHEAYAPQHSPGTFANATFGLVWPHPPSSLSPISSDVRCRAQSIGTAISERPQLPLVSGGPGRLTSLLCTHSYIVAHICAPMPPFRQLVRM